MPSNSNLIDFQNLIDRAIAICTETISGSEGRSFWYYSQEAFPYFIGRIDTVDTEFVDEDEIVTYTFNLRVRHITGNRTEGLTTTGEGEAKLYAQMSPVINALLSSDLLQSDTYPLAPDWIESIELAPVPGLQTYDGSGIGAVGLQIGTTYTMNIKARVQIDETYE